MNAPTSFGGMTLQADKLGSCPAIRHAFFTRVGGVSEGIYATLNGGVGSNDAPAASPRTAPAWRQRSAARRTVC